MRKRRCAKRFEIDGPHKVEIQKAIWVRIRLVNPPEVERLKQVKRAFRKAIPKLNDGLQDAKS